MHSRLRSVAFVALCALCVSPLHAQPSQPEAAPAAVDRLFRIGGALPAGAFAGTSTTEPVLFAIYDRESAGTLLWQEVQNLTVDAQGRYSVLLGATSQDGLPVELFAGGEARWLSVQGKGGAAGPRTLLTSVPYALTAVNAANADSLGGRPASSYLLAPSARGDGSAAGRASDPVFRTLNPLSAGTIGQIGKFVTGTDLGDSVMTESAGRIGIGTTAPVDVLHARFTDAGGGIAGVAVQNLSSAAGAYSGMLFYDHLGNLVQFQGVNNSTKEYRVNNIATGGSINFMLGGTSRVLVQAGSGNVGISEATPAYRLDVSHGGATGIRSRSSATFSVIDIDAANGDAALRLARAGVNQWNIRNRPSDDALEFFELGGGGSRVIIQDATGNVGIGETTNPLDKLHVAGDIRVGTGTTGCVKDADGTVLTGVCSSDLRFKKDVTPFGPMLDRFSRLTPVNYYWRSAEFADRHFGTAQSFGLIAQDVQKEFPDLVKIDEQGYLAVNYSKLPLLAIQAVKELKAENDTLKAQSAALESRLSALEAAIKVLQRP